MLKASKGLLNHLCQAAKKVWRETHLYTVTLYACVWTSGAVSMIIPFGGQTARRLQIEPIDRRTAPPRRSDYDEAIFTR